jgi:DNA-binding SARP family transcriptional activator
VEAIIRLAKHHLETREYEATLSYCRRALSEDPCLEAAHRMAMCAYAGMGNRAGVVRQFEYCRKALLEEIDAPPSPQTETLYKTLVR